MSCKLVMRELLCDHCVSSCIRALAGQIDQLKVYCINGLVWDERQQSYEVDTSGCFVKSTYGEFD